MDTLFIKTVLLSAYCLRITAWNNSESVQSFRYVQYLANSVHPLLQWGNSKFASEKMQEFFCLTFPQKRNIIIY